MLTITTEGTRLRLAGELDIYAMADLHGHLQQRLAAGGLTALDLAKVERIDGSGVQLLWWLRGQLEHHGVALALENLDGPVRDALKFVRFPGVAS